MGEAGSSASLSSIFFPTGSLGWFIVNLTWDIVLGIGAYILLVLVIPRFQDKAKSWSYPDKNGILRWRPYHPKWFVAYAWLQVIALVVVLWGIFLTLVFSIGWEAPLSKAAIWFDLIYARANGEPNGAHIFSWLSCAGFGIVVWFKTMPRPVKTFHDALGDPFQGIAALIFIGGVHEIIWVPFYYIAYLNYLSWSIWLEVGRDISFAIMMIAFVLTFIKEPTRVIPLGMLKPVIKFYVVYLFLWFFVPVLFGFHAFPVSTVNNTNLGQGPYLETPWFGLWWVNAIESISWILLCWPAMWLVLKYRRPATVS